MSAHRLLVSSVLATMLATANGAVVCNSPNATGSTFTASSGTIGSDSDLNGVGTSYAASQVCSWNIGCPSGNNVTFTLEGSTYNSSDSVVVTAVDTSTARTFYGAFAGITVLSNSNNIVVTFTTDGSTTTVGPGWSLQWSCSASAQMCLSPSTSNSTTGNGTTYLQGDSGSIMSDADGSGTASAYALGQTCVWHVQCAAGGSSSYLALFSLVNLDIRHSLSVFDGATGTLLDANAGRVQTKIYSTTDIKIVFDSQSTASRYTSSGWTLNWQCSTDKCSAAQPGSGSVLSSPATIKSDFDGSAAGGFSFASGEKCVWELECPRGNRYLYVDYSATLGSSAARLKVELPAQSFQSVLDVSTGTTTNSKVTASLGAGDRPSTAKITFTSSSTIGAPSGGGFSMVLRCAVSQCGSPNQTTTTTTGSYTATTGTIVSDLDGIGSASTYNDNEQCVWDVTCPSGYHFAVAKYQDWMPVASFVQIKGSNETANYTFPRTHTYYSSGTDSHYTRRLASSESAIFTNSQSATIYFSTYALSTTYNNKSGFSLTYECLPEPCLGTGQINTQATRGLIQLGSGTGGTPGSLCSWNVTCDVETTPKLYLPTWYSGGSTSITSKVYADTTAVNGSGKVDILQVNYSQSLLTAASSNSGSVFYDCLKSGTTNFQAYDGAASYGSRCYSPNATDMNPSKPDMFLVPSGKTSYLTTDPDGYGDGYEFSYSFCRFSVRCAEPSDVLLLNRRGYFEKSSSSTPAPTAAPTGSQACTNSDYSKCRDIANDCCVKKRNPESHSCAGGYKLVETQHRCTKYKGDPENHREYSCVPSGSSCTTAGSTSGSSQIGFYRILSDDLKTPLAVSTRGLTDNFAFYNGVNATFDIFTRLKSRGHTVTATCLTPLQASSSSSIASRDSPSVCFHGNGTSFSLGASGSKTFKSDYDGLKSSYIGVMGTKCSYRVTCPTGYLLNTTLEGRDSGRFRFTSATTGDELGPNFPLTWSYDGYTRSSSSTRRYYSTKNISIPVNDVWIHWESNLAYAEQHTKNQGWNLLVKCVPAAKSNLRIPQAGDGDCTLRRANGDRVTTYNKLSSSGQHFPFGSMRPSRCHLTFDCSKVSGAHTMIISLRGIDSYTTNYPRKARLLWETKPVPRVVANITNARQMTGRSTTAFVEMISAENGNQAVLQMAYSWNYLHPTQIYCLSGSSSRPLGPLERSLTKLSNLYTYRGSSKYTKTYGTTYTDLPLRLSGKYRRGLDQWTLMECRYATDRLAIIGVEGNVDTETAGNDYLELYNGENDGMVTYTNTKYKAHTSAGITGKSVLVHFRSASSGGDGKINNGYRIKYRCGKFSVGQSVTEYTDKDGASSLSTTWVGVVGVLLSLMQLR